MLRWCLVLPVTFFVGGHEGLKLGSPFYYWHNGSLLPFLALMVVLVLLLWQLNHIVKLRHASRELVTGAISLAALAFVILQYLPEPEIGIRLLPVFPWRFSDTLASISAVIVWLMIFVGIGFTHDAEGDGPLPGLFCAFMFIAFTLNATLSFSATTTSKLADACAAEFIVPTKHVDFAEKLIDYREAVRHWRSQATSLRQKLAHLTHDRQAVLQIISTITESDSTPPLELAQERDELNQQIGRIQLEIASIENAMLKSESNLRRIERKQSTKQALERPESDFEALAMIRRELQDLAELSE